MPRLRLSHLFLASRQGDSAPVWVRAINGIGVFLGAAWVGWEVLRRTGLHWDWEAVYGYGRLFASGWMTTVGISLGALALSTILGVLIALLSRSRVLALRYAVQGYVELVRGTPLLAQIYILFYIVAEAVHLENRTIAGILTLSIFSGAYLSEVFRAGIESVGKSQIESAQAIGLTRLQTYRYVIFPQALRVALPAMTGQFVSLIKDSSLLSVIGVNELTQNARNVASYTFSNFESYLLLAVGYLLLTLPLSLWTRRLESRFRYET
jgi:polar amino acid transport system permease protein